MYYEKKRKTKKPKKTKKLQDNENGAKKDLNIVEHSK